MRSVGNKLVALLVLALVATLVLLPDSAAYWLVKELLVAFLILGLVVALLRRIRGSALPAAINNRAAALSQAQSATPTSVELERLGDLRARGVLTEDEFIAAKGRVVIPSPPQAEPSTGRTPQ